MSTRPTISSIAPLLISVVLMPSLFFALPSRVHAQMPPLPIAVPTQGAGLNDFITTVEGILTQVNTFTSAAANYANYINTYILQPIAFVMSGQLMKALTASVMKFVIGKANGTGIPQFTVDIQKSLRSISDMQKNAYLRQVNLTNSPFATSIAQALDINYNQSTSLAGFWAANQCTLGQNIPTYQPGYLAGNWAQGGTAAWFQLTTQTQNNPYILYQNSQAQLANVIGAGVGGGSGARLAQLSWGQGYMSWCGTSDSATYTQNAASSAYQACIAQCNNVGYTPQCANSCGESFSQNGGIIAGGGINPGDPCTKEDGTAGIMQTPGSTIKATLDKVLGGQQDKLVQMGNISSQVNSILGNIGTVLNTINLAANILGGGSSGGLLSAGQPSGSLSRFDAPNTASSSNLTTGYGTSASQIQRIADSSAVTAATRQSTSTNRTAADFGVGGGTTAAARVAAIGMEARVALYTAAWDTITAAANAAKTALVTLSAACTTVGNQAQATAADNALTQSVQPTLTQSAAASTTAALALAANAATMAEANQVPLPSTFAADLQKLSTMSPTATDLTLAQRNATVSGGAIANPAGSLTVLGGSRVDQLNLIAKNAAIIQSLYCTPNGY